MDRPGLANHPLPTGGAQGLTQGHRFSMADAVQKRNACHKSAYGHEKSSSEHVTTHSPLHSIELNEIATSARTACTPRQRQRRASLERNEKNLPHIAAPKSK